MKLHIAVVGASVAALMTNIHAVRLPLQRLRKTDDKSLDTDAFSPSESAGSTMTMTTSESCTGTSPAPAPNESVPDGDLCSYTGSVEEGRIVGNDNECQNANSGSTCTCMPTNQGIDPCDAQCVCMPSGGFGVGGVCVNNDHCALSPDTGLYCSRNTTSNEASFGVCASCPNHCIEGGGCYHCPDDDKIKCRRPLDESEFIASCRLSETIFDPTTETTSGDESFTIEYELLVHQRATSNWATLEQNINNFLIGNLKTENHPTIYNTTFVGAAKSAHVQEKGIRRLQYEDYYTFYTSGSCSGCETSGLPGGDSINSNRRFLQGGNVDFSSLQHVVKLTNPDATTNKSPAEGNGQDKTAVSV